MFHDEALQRAADERLQQLIRDGPDKVLLSPGGQFVRLEEAMELPFIVELGIVLVSRTGFSIGAPRHLEKELTARFPSRVWGIARAVDQRRGSSGRREVDWTLAVIKEDET